MPRHDRNHKLLTLGAIGVVGLLAEAIGVWLVFAWFKTVPRSLADPRLFVGGVLALLGFVILIRGLSFIIKQIILMTISEN